MNPTFEPREVDKPFVARWLRAALALFLRSPIRFGALIALLTLVDSWIVKEAHGYFFEREWVDRLGTTVLPILWIIVAATARGADDANQTWRALAQLRRPTVWMSALGAGAGLAASQYVVAFAFQWLPGLLGLHKQTPYLRHPGQFLGSIESSVLLMSIFVGICYFPLLALVPDITRSQAAALSRRATKLNNDMLLLMLVAICALVAIAVQRVLPAYGLTTAAFLVFMGILNYVVYRDIFERRDKNLPQTSQLITAPSERVRVAE